MHIFYVLSFLKSACTLQPVKSYNQLNSNGDLLAIICANVNFWIVVHDVTYDRNLGLS